MIISFITALAAPAPEKMRAKARHYFLLGCIADAEGRNDAAFEYYKKAFRTDTSYREAGYHYGLSRLTNRLDTMATATEVDRSLEQLRQFVDSYPADIQESLYYAYASGYRGNVNEAARVYLRIDSLRPDRTSTKLALADLELGRRNYTEALRLIDRYQEIEGENPQLCVERVKILYSLRDTVGAVGETDRLIKRYPREPQYLMLRGNLHDVMGDSAARLADLMQAEKIAPQNGAVKLALADYALEHGDSAAFDQKTYEALLSEDFELAEKKELILQYLSRLFSDSADVRRGNALFKVLNQQYPHNASVLELEARYRMAISETETAIELLTYASDLEPDNPSLYEQLMTSQLLTQNYDGAMQTYRRAKKAGVMTDNMPMFYAISAFNAHKYKEAIETYSEMLMRIANFDDPTLPISQLPNGASLSSSDLDKMKSIYISVGDAFYSDGNTPSAYAAYDNALAIDAHDPLVLNNYAYFLSEEDRELDKALKMSREATDLEPENPTYLDTLAWILHKLGRNAEALEIQQNAMTLAEDSGYDSEEFSRHLNEIEKALGNKPEGRGNNKTTH